MSAVATVQDVRRRAATGVLTVGLRNLLVRGLGFLGTIVLARLLTPSDYGVLALGFAIVLLGSYLATAGLGASLVRREAEPARDELGTVLGFQLVATLALAGAIAAVGLSLGGFGSVAAIMACSLPVTVLRVPTGAVLERHLNFGPAMRAEVVDALVYNGAAIALVLAGAGIWGVAAATVIGPLAGTIVLVATGGVGVPRPRLSLGRLRPMLRFGLAYQSVSLASTVRDQGLVLVVGAVGGAAVLGVWAIAYRLLQAVLLLLEALGRVAFPAMSRLVAMGDDGARVLERALRLTSVAVGIPVVALAGTAAAFVPTVFGARWEAAVPVLPLGAAALMLSGPVSTTAAGFLFAKGDGASVLRAVSLQAALWIGVAAALAPLAGAVAAGVGMVVGAAAAALMLTRAVRRHAQVNVVANVWRPTVVALAAGLGGWAATTVAGTGLAGLVLSLAVAEGLYLSGIWFAQPDAARHGASTLRMALER